MIYSKLLNFVWIVIWRQKLIVFLSNSATQQMHFFFAKSRQLAFTGTALHKFEIKI